MMFLIILFLFMFCFFLIAYNTAGVPLPAEHNEYPADRDKPALELPDFARTDDKDQRLREELAALLRTRGELERVFRLGVLFPLAIRFDDIGKVHEYWLSLADREKNVYAAALAAALRRLRPKDMPAGTADSRQGGILARLAEGERHFLLGLSCLRLYDPFRRQARDTALTAWRQAVEHFRHSAAAPVLGSQRSSQSAPRRFTSPGGRPGSPLTSSMGPAASSSGVSSGSRDVQQGVSSLSGKASRAARSPASTAARAASCFNSLLRGRGRRRVCHA